MLCDPQSNAGYQSGALRVKDVSGPVTLSQLRVTRNKADGVRGRAVETMHN